MQVLTDSLASAFGPATAIGLGLALRRTNLFSTADGETAAKFALWVTLPSLIVQSFNGLTLAALQLPVLVGAAAVAALSAALSWLCYRQRHPKERGLLAGAAAAGTSLALAAYPLVHAFFGAPGLRVALLCGAVNSLAVWVGSYLLFATAGAAFPEQYAHLDGGTYRGEWLGMLKQGHGVYTYPGGARYEGEWRNNVKEGRGVYRFPKGGVYEGEWRRGKMEGVGVRTFASGKVQAGFWREGKLSAEMEEWQCALAVEGAGEAAAVARRVQVGGGGGGDALRQLLSDPATWAFAGAAALAVTGRQLTPTLDLLTASLAAAHAPLALVAFGLTTELSPPQQRQASDVAGVLAIRLLPPLALAAAACAVQTRLGWPAWQVLGLVGPMLVCAVAPAAPQVLAYAYRFRLNENLAAAITRSSTAAGLLLMPLLAAAASVSAAAGSVLPFVVALAGVAAAVAAAAAAAAAGLLQGKQQQMQGKVFMKYAPAPGAAAAAAAGPRGGQAAGGSGDSSGSAAPAAVQQQRPAAQGAPAAASPAAPQAAAAPEVAASQPADAAADPAGRPGGSSSVEAASPAAGDGTAAAVAAPEPPPQQPPPPRRRSAFSDVAPDQPPPLQPPQAQPAWQPSSSGSSGTSRVGRQQQQPLLVLQPRQRHLLPRLRLRSGGRPACLSHASAVAGAARPL